MVVAVLVLGVFALDLAIKIPFDRVKWGMGLRRDRRTGDPRLFELVDLQGTGVAATAEQNEFFERSRIYRICIAAFDRVGVPQSPPLRQRRCVRIAWGWPPSAAYPRFAAARGSPPDANGVCADEVYVGGRNAVGVDVRPVSFHTPRAAAHAVAYPGLKAEARWATGAPKTSIVGTAKVRRNTNGDSYPRKRPDSQPRCRGRGLERLT